MSFVKTFFNKEPREIVKKDIPFKTQEKEDDKLSWRTRKTTQKGEKGIKEISKAHRDI